MVGERKLKQSEKKVGAARSRGEFSAAELAVTYDRFPGIADDLPALSAEYILLNKQVKEIEERKAALRNEIEIILEASGEKILAGEFFVAHRVTSRKPRKLSPERLLENGVTMEVIDDSYTGGEEYEYLQVTERSE